MLLGHRVGMRMDALLALESDGDDRDADRTTYTMQRADLDSAFYARLSFTGQRSTEYEGADADLPKSLRCQDSQQGNWCLGDRLLAQRRPCCCEGGDNVVVIRGG
jgi:hypothetical protein